MCMIIKSVFIIIQNAFCIIALNKFKGWILYTISIEIYLNLPFNLEDMQTANNTVI